MISQLSSLDFRILPLDTLQELTWIRICLRKVALSSIPYFTAGSDNVIGEGAPDTAKSQGTISVNRPTPESRIGEEKGEKKGDEPRADKKQDEE